MEPEQKEVGELAPGEPHPPWPTALVSTGPPPPPPAAKKAAPPPLDDGGRAPSRGAAGGRRSRSPPRRPCRRRAGALVIESLAATKLGTWRNWRTGTGSLSSLSPRGPWTTMPLWRLLRGSFSALATARLQAAEPAAAAAATRLPAGDPAAAAATPPSSRKTSSTESYVGWLRSNLSQSVSQSVSLCTSSLHLCGSQTRALRVSKVPKGRVPNVQ